MKIRELKEVNYQHTQNENRDQELSYEALDKCFDGSLMNLPSFVEKKEIFDFETLDSMARLLMPSNMSTYLEDVTPLMFHNHV